MVQIKKQAEEFVMTSNLGMYDGRMADESS